MSIVVEDLRHVYHPGTPLETIALDGVSLSVEQGKWISIVGHTGSGKSTLAQHLNALMLPDEGSVSVDGIAAEKGNRDLRSIRRKVGLVFQYPEQQLFAETVHEEVAFAPANWEVPRERIDDCVRHALFQVGLDGVFLKRSPFRLSGGEKRRLAIASVLSGGPSYLVLDEPTAGLDASGRRDLMQLLTSICAEGIGIVLITHDLELALESSDRVLVLERGRSRCLDTALNVAEYLASNPVAGLRLPDVALLSLRLRERGMDLPVTWNQSELLELISRQVQQ